VIRTETGRSRNRSSISGRRNTVQLVPEVLYLALRRPRQEADHLPLSIAEIKNQWSLGLYGVHRDNFTVTLIYVTQAGP
jgi:hypothetical protein